MSVGDDIVSKIVEANALENAGQAAQAIALYQEILELDRGNNYGDVAQQALDNLQQLPSLTVEQTQDSPPNSQRLPWERLNLKVKLPLIVIALTIFPCIIVGSTAYSLVNQSITQEISATEKLDTQRNLAWTLTLSTTGISIITAAIAYLSARKLVQPIVEASNAVEKLGQGEFRYSFAYYRTR